jgi:hypothetical protein
MDAGLIRFCLTKDQVWELLLVVEGKIMECENSLDSLDNYPINRQDLEKKIKRLVLLRDMLQCEIDVESLGDENENL